jgi:hypothetical protein
LPVWRSSRGYRASTPNTPNSQAAREPETMPADPLPHLTQP